MWSFLFDSGQTFCTFPHSYLIEDTSFLHDLCVWFVHTRTPARRPTPSRSSLVNTNTLMTVLTQHKLTHSPSLPIVRHSHTPSQNEKYEGEERRKIRRFCFLRVRHSSSLSNSILNTNLNLSRKVKPTQVFYNAHVKIFDHWLHVIIFCFVRHREADHERLVWRHFLLLSEDEHFLVCRLKRSQQLRKFCDFTYERVVRE